MRPSKERRKHFLGCDVVGSTEREDPALAFTASPKAHWLKLRVDCVQERAEREIKLRYRVVQSFPLRELMLCLSCANPWR